MLIIILWQKSRNNPQIISIILSGCCEDGLECTVWTVRVVHYRWDENTDTIMYVCIFFFISWRNRFSITLISFLNFYKFNIFFSPHNYLLNSVNNIWYILKFAGKKLLNNDSSSCFCTTAMIAAVFDWRHLFSIVSMARCSWYKNKK